MNCDLNIKILEKQIKYSEKNAFETAKNIIYQKIRNQNLLITNYSLSHKRAKKDTYSKLEEIQNKIKTEQEKVLNSQKQSEVFSTEGVAAKRYWEAIDIIAKRSREWDRIKINPKDSLNIALNNGYHFLFTKIENILTEEGFSVEIGLLHSRETKKPLVYDIVELFRSPFVEKTILPFFSKRKSESEIEEREINKIFGKLKERMGRKVEFRGRSVTFENYIRKQIRDFKKCLQEDKVWRPEEFRWGHHQYELK